MRCKIRIKFQVAIRRRKTGILFRDIDRIMKVNRVVRAKSKHSA